LNQPSETSTRTLGNGNRWIAALAIGLAIGLLLGVFIGVVFDLPNVLVSPNIENPVKVSGTVSFTQFGSVQFINSNESMDTRYDHHVEIIFGRYSITLSGGHTYTVVFGLPGATSEYPQQFSVYIPSNTTTLTANF
jgi:hypothetical protein